MREREAWFMHGLIGVVAIILLLVIAIYSFFQLQIAIGIISLLIAGLLISGITFIQPNQSIVVIFLGKYMGSIRKEGVVVTIPLSVRRTVSLRVRNFNSKQLKVNDVQGNPIEIAAVIVFKVVDSAKAVFDVDHYEQFVQIQSEAAIRSVATKYPYDTFNDDELSLRGNANEVSEQLTYELQERLKVSGVEVIEARLIHLAYSTEIAQAMLQRQQASAIIAARRLIVDGAVSIVDDAIEQLETEVTLQLDDHQRAQMINNLLVAIVADHGAQPVINTSTLS